MLGCAIHELCSLAKPFMGESLNVSCSFINISNVIFHFHYEKKAVINKIMNERHSTIPKAHGYSDFLINLVDKMLDKNPDNRPDIYSIINEPKVKKEV
jgi:serine/threonine protein kinase